MTSSERVDLTGPLPGVRYEPRDGVAWITLDRPDRGNSLTPGMQRVFRAIWTEVREDPWISAAIVSEYSSTAPPVPPTSCRACTQ